MGDKIVIRILIVEDDPAVAAWMGEAITGLGDVVDHVGIAGSYDDAVKELLDDSRRPCVLVTDLKLPNGYDGIALGKILRHKDEHAIIVCVTGYPNLLFRREVVELPVDYFLLKPFSSEQLHLTCLKAVGDYFMRRRFSRCLERRMSNYEADLQKLRAIEERSKTALSTMLSMKSET